MPVGSQVLLYLGEEAPEERVAVPDFSGMNRQQAADAADKAGVYIRCTGNPDTDINVVVTAQDRPAGDSVPRGTTITVQFADIGARD